MTSPAPEPVRARDRALRRTRASIAAIAAGAVALSGVVSVVAAQAFKGHSQRRPTVKATAAQRGPQRHVRVPGPQSVPAIAGQPAPLQPPAQAPTPAPPQAAAPAPAPAPAPQVSGGS